MSAIASAVSGVCDAGLTTAVLPHASAGAIFQLRDHGREVPRRDQRAHADRLAQRDVDARRHDRDRLAGDLVRRAAPVLEDVRHDVDLARARCRSACRRSAPRAARAPPAGRGSGTTLASGPGPARARSSVARAPPRTRGPRPRPRERRPRRRPAPPATRHAGGGLEHLGGRARGGRRPARRPAPAARSCGTSATCPSDASTTARSSPIACIASSARSEGAGICMGGMVVPCASMRRCGWRRPIWRGTREDARSSGRAGAATSRPRSCRRAPRSKHTAPSTVVDLDDLPDDALVMPIAGWGAPTVGIEKLGSGREGAALAAAVRRWFDAPVAAVMAGEIGGGNGVLPVAVAAELRAAAGRCRRDGACVPRGTTGRDARGGVVPDAGVPRRRVRQPGRPRSRATATGSNASRAQ